MRKLILVKHAQPAIDPAIPANQWRLSPEGQVGCMRLARYLAAHQPAAIISSTEPKAVETAQAVASILHVPCQAAPDLHEHDRSNVPFQDKASFEAAVAAFFARPHELVFGRETAAQAEERFTRGVEMALRAHPQGNVVIVAHGTVITLFVTRTDRSRIDPFAFWQRLGLPSYVLFALPDGERLEVVNAV